MGDLLSASSLLLALAAVLFGMWYPDIIAAANLKLEPHKENRGPQKRQIRQTLLGRALPVATILTLIFLVFVPETWKIVAKYVLGGVDIFANYDAVEAAFVLTQVVTFFIAVYSIFRLVSLLVKLVKSYL